MLALDEWSEKALQGIVPAGHLFAWDGGMRVLVGKVDTTAEARFRPQFVLRFHAEVLALIGQGKNDSGTAIERVRTRIRSELARRAHREDGDPVVIGLDLRSLGLYRYH